MVSSGEADRLRREARTVFANIETVEAALEEARSSEGDHWETGELTLDLESPSGETLEVALDVEMSAAENAQTRYDRAKEVEAELDERRKVQGELADAPPDPLAFLVLKHLKTVKGDYPRSMARNLDAERKEVVEACGDLETRGLLERVESGMLKRRDVKLKRSHETHQHHTYYRLSRDGDHVLRALREPEGKEGFLRKVPGALEAARRLSDGGPDYPRMTADALDMDPGYVERLYRAMAVAGLVKTYDGSTIKGEERRLKPKDETHRKHTYYVTTRAADLVLREMD